MSNEQDSGWKKITPDMIVAFDEAKGESILCTWAKLGDGTIRELTTDEIKAMSKFQSAWSGIGEVVEGTRAYHLWEAFKARMKDGPPVINPMTR